MKPHLLIPCLLSLSLPLHADIELPSFFSDGMVLQRDGKASIWGNVAPNQTVTITLGAETISGKSDNEGAFRVSFKGLKATKRGQVLVIAAGDDEKTINDVLVGEVWLASGQSNMEWPMKRTNGAGEATTAVDPLLRVYVAGNNATSELQNDFKGTWEGTEPGKTPEFTAVGYEFAKCLREELQVPVGIIEAAWGGKPIEAFMSAEVVEKLPEAEKLVKRKAWEKASYQKRLERWNDKKEGKKPADPDRNPSLYPNIYNGHIAPLIGYGIKGAIWYQGESNANPNTASNYAELQAAMIGDWRQRWGYDFSFYYVQLANFDQLRTPAHWVTVQDEQLKMLANVQKTGMAVINDIGDPNDIHPRNKAEVGRRLSLWALKNDYGKSDLEVSGPLFNKHELRADKIAVFFHHSDGLKASKGDELKGFEISDQDGNWFPATAVVKNGCIELSSTDVTKPTHARYAWKSSPEEANLTNSTGLPASCFTTDS